MVYFRTDTNNMVAFVHYMPFDETYGLGKTEEELQASGYLVESLPEYTEVLPEGKIPRLYYDGSEFSWQLEDVPKSGTTRIEELEQRIAELEALNTAYLGTEEE